MPLYRRITTGRIGSNSKAAETAGRRADSERNGPGNINRNLGLGQKTVKYFNKPRTRRNSRVCRLKVPYVSRGDILPAIKRRLIRCRFSPFAFAELFFYIYMYILYRHRIYRSFVRNKSLSFIYAVPFSRIPFTCLCSGLARTPAHETPKPTRVEKLVHTPRSSSPLARVMTCLTYK